MFLFWKGVFSIVVVKMKRVKQKTVVYYFRTAQNIEVTECRKEVERNCKKQTYRIITVVTVSYYFITNIFNSIISSLIL